ncbi:MAG TPA: hypothetical protein VIX73_05330, partial [Kofleriaceae bacterium]
MRGPVSRLLVRIWLHGILLFAGLIVTIAFARYILPGHDAALTAHTHPRIALGLAERALAVRDDRATLARDLRANRAQMSVDVSLYRADGTLIASSSEPALPAMTPDEQRALVPLPGYVSLARDRVVVGAFADGALAAYAVAQTPQISFLSPHALALIAVAVVLSLVFVALPLWRSIARPLAQVGA